MEVLERSSIEERVVVIEWGKKKKKVFIFWFVVARSVPSLWNFFVLVFFWVGQAFSSMASIFLLISIIFRQIPTKQIKITQNKQNKSDKTRGLPPTKHSFKVISLTVRRLMFLNLGYVDHCV